MKGLVIMAQIASGMRWLAGWEHSRGVRVYMNAYGFTIIPYECIVDDVIEYPHEYPMRDKQGILDAEEALESALEDIHSMNDQFDPFWYWRPEH
jgi:hypothetical protein